MKRRTFFLFVAPSVAMMLLFIATPLVTVFLQSFQNTQSVFREETVERCTPGFPAPICSSEKRTVPTLDAQGRPVTRTVWVGLDNYWALLRPAEVAAAFAPGGGGLSALLSIDFYRALRFTLTFTFVTLPLVIGIGLALALALNATVRSIRGPIIFVTLLPFIITPVIGALSIRWLFVGDGIMTAALRELFDRPS